MPSITPTDGIKGLGYWDNGFKNLSLNSPVRAAEDLRGKKLRIQSSKVLDDQMRAVGVLPQVMAFSDGYLALQTGVVDGTATTHPTSIRRRSTRCRVT